MSRYITKQQYKTLNKIPRDRLATRAKVYCGTIVQDKGKILLVLEADSKHSGYDFPGGKLLWGENIKACAMREFVEETGHHVKLTNLVSIYQRANIEDESDYFRFIFAGSIDTKKKRLQIDETVMKLKWVKVEDIVNKRIKLRNPQIYTEIVRYLDNHAVGLDMLGEYSW